MQISRYLAKISGPLLDRIDLQVEVPALSAEEIASTTRGETSASIRARVEAARAALREREVDAAARRILDQALHRLGLSARAYDRALKVAQTIAALAGSERVESAHVAEAVQYRALDRAYFRKTA
jgi:magnesium chelatase family protein